jgi:REP element-mobilizing transposase RayT
MAHTYSLNYVHCVFSTKRRLPLITDPEKVWDTMRKVACAERLDLFAVGGVADHIHLLVSIPATRTVSDVVRDLKCNSSLRIRKWNRLFSWQNGYASISVSPLAISSVKAYIARQELHHRSRSFEQEYTSILERAGITYDMQFLFD